MRGLPTGTVTFLFTAIEGSTKLWERSPNAMQRALARHDEILKEAVEGHDGYVFKTVGDAFCCAFRTASAALKASLFAQRALFSEEGWPEETGPLRVKMALHTGAAEERDGDYFGPPLNRVARLLSAGHGGQVLLSLTTQELVQPYCNASSKRPFRGAGGTILHIRKDMRVGVKCDRGARVPQHLGNELGIDVSPQQKRNATFSHSCSVSTSASPHWWPSQACYAVHPRPSTGNGHPSRFRVRGPKNPRALRKMVN